MISGRPRISRKVKQRDAGALQRKAEPVPPDGEITEFLGS